MLVWSHYSFWTASFSLVPRGHHTSLFLPSGRGRRFSLGSQGGIGMEDIVFPCQEGNPLTSQRHKICYGIRDNGCQWDLESLESWSCILIVSHEQPQPAHLLGQVVSETLVREALSHIGWHKYGYWICRLVPWVVASSNRVLNCKLRPGSELLSTVVLWVNQGCP